MKTATNNHRKPIFIINTKSYLHGQNIIKLARIADNVAAKKNIDFYFSAPPIDLSEIQCCTTNLIITAQHVDYHTPGKGMGRVLPEGLKSHNINSVILNHAEFPLSLSILNETIKRMKKFDIISIVCADTVEECKKIAKLYPDIMICEPSNLIGTGKTSASSYRINTTSVIKSINENIRVIQGAGVKSSNDVERIMNEGADGTGGTSGIIESSDWERKIEHMTSSLFKI